jgi:hypothetical protein
MLMRAFAIRRQKTPLPTITVVSRGANKDLQERYTRLFRGAKLTFFEGGIETFVETEASNASQEPK